MYAARMTLVNWGNLPIADFPLGPVTLLTGGSGTGKTTMADAIQSIMTAVKRSLYTYNPGQEETTQHGRHGKTPRSLASYILGCDDNLYARPNGAYGYVAIVFAPSVGEDRAQVFTAILGVSAYLEEVERAGGRKLRTPKEEQVRLMLVSGHGIGISDLADIESVGVVKAVRVDSVVTVLRQKYGDAAVHDFGDNKGAYLCKLYGMLRGRPAGVSVDEAEKAARSFSRFMAYKPIESIDQFVRTQVLEPRDMGEEIDHISGTMRRVQELRSDSERLNRNVAMLSDAERDGDALRAGWRDACESEVRYAYKLAHDADQEAESCQEKVKELNAEQHRLRQRVEAIKNDLESLSQQKADILASLRQNKNVVQRDDLQARLSEHEKAAQDALGELFEALTAAEVNLEIAKQLDKLPARIRADEFLAPRLQEAQACARDLMQHDLAAIRSQALVLARASKTPDPSQLQALADAIAGIDEAHELFVLTVGGPENSLRSQAEQLFGREQPRNHEAKQKELDLQKRIDDLEKKGKVNYPPPVEKALRHIKESLPGADPVILCDVIEMRDPIWQSAVEGYLGQNRFQFIVNAQYEARAVHLVRSLQQRGAKVVQGEKALRDAVRIDVPTKSIVNTVATDNPVAKAYLVAAYGSVVRVPDTEELRQTSRGVTVEGHGSANYAMFACNLPDDELVFGKSGRERQLRALNAKLDEARLFCRDRDDYLGAIEQVRRLCQRVSQIKAEKSAEALLSASRSIVATNDRIARIDLSDVRELDEEHARLNEETKRLGDERDRLLPRDGAIDEARAGLRQTIAAKEVEHENAMRLASDAVGSLTRYAQTADDYDAEEAHRRLREEAEIALLTQDSAKSAISAGMHRAQTAMGKFIKDLRDYNALARRDEQITYQPDLDSRRFEGWSEFYALMDSFVQVRTQLRRQRENRLMDVTKELQKTEKEMRNTFTAQFCQIIYDAVRRGDQHLNGLNDDLRRHRFSEETYEFEREWVPEYKRYYDFFEAVIQIDRIGEGEDLFGGDKLTSDQVAVRDELVALLLDPDYEKARIKLLDIADYRNYKRFDILRMTEGRDRKDATRLSEWGSASGGQFENPHYIIRAAAVSSAYRLGEGDQHLRMVLIDESFAKMDEARAREVIRMLSRTLRFQVIFVMPSKASGPFFPLVTHKLVFSKVRSTAAPGEMTTVTYVDQQVIETEAVERLWEAQRQAARAEILRQFKERQARDRGMA